MGLTHNSLAGPQGVWTATVPQSHTQISPPKSAVLIGLPFQSVVYTKPHRWHAGLERAWIRFYVSTATPVSLLFCSRTACG